MLVQNYVVICYECSAFKDSFWLHAIFYALQLVKTEPVTGVATEMLYQKLNTL